MKGGGDVSHQRAADSLLLDALFAETPIGLGFWDAEFRYRRLNDVLAAMNGLPVAKHLGRRISDVLPQLGPELEERFAQILATGEAQLEIDVTGTPASPDEERVLEATYFPVVAEPDRLLGVGAVVRDVTERHALEQQRRRLLDQALDAKAAADDERRAANAARRRATFLATVTRRMAASLDYEATLREVTASAVPYIADWCLISVLEPGDRLRIIGFAHRDPERERIARAFAEERPAELRANVMRVLQSGRPDVQCDVTPEDLAAIAGDQDRLEMLRQLGVRHLGTWPVPGPNGQVLGALSLVLGDPGRRFTDGDLELAAALATRAGLHITNARLYTERSEIARILQAGLLPRALPDVPGVEVASAFVAAGVANLVGGDFLDVFADGDRGGRQCSGTCPGRARRPLPSQPVCATRSAPPRSSTPALRPTSTCSTASC